MNNENSKWAIFKKTGKIEDYLEYRKQNKNSILKDEFWKKLFFITIYSLEWERAELIWKILRQLE